VAAAVHGAGREALIVPADVTDQGQVDQVVQAALDRWHRVDILVANAGDYVRCPISELNRIHLEHAMAVNYYGSVYAVLAALPSMLSQGSGHIVLVASMNGKKGVPPDAPYAAAKFALSGFGEVLRQELHGTGVHATTVFPGRVDTPMIETLHVPRISAKISAESVADSIVRAIDRRSPEVVIPILSRGLILANTISPRLGDWIVRVFHLEGWGTDSVRGT
jgi:short-subunit dehydrogenase